MITWWMYALFGALVWGVHYNFIAKALTSISPITAYFLPNVVLMVTLPLWYKILVQDYHNIMNAANDVKMAITALLFTSILGTVAVYKAIHGSNATLASLLELVYPVLVAVFALLMYEQNHFTWPVVVGGTLIIAGSSIIVYFHG